MLIHLWERYRVFILGGVVLLFLALSCLYYPGTSTIAPSIPFQTPVYASEQSNQPSSLQNPLKPAASPSNPSELPGSSSVTSKQLYVDVKGKVKQPGIYAFTANERVHHVIMRAGGLLPDADRNRINLALPLSDGMVVWIPSMADKTSQTNTSLASLSSPCVEVQSKPSSPTPSNLTGTSDKINLNTATVDQLCSLPGVGEAKAKAIRAYREKKGGFTNVKQLLEVTGIGEKMFEKIKEKVTL